MKRWNAIAIKAPLQIPNAFEKRSVGITLAEDDGAGKDRLAKTVGKGPFDVFGDIAPIVDRSDRLGDPLRVGSDT